MLPAKKRGLTTQNTAPSVSSGAACAFVAMVTRTCALSGDSRRLFTVPNSISLNLSGDLPACRPSALSNETSIVGPSFDSVSQTSQRGDRDRQQGNQPDRREPVRSTGDRLRRSRRCVGDVHHAPLWSDPIGSALAGNLFSTCLFSCSRDHLDRSLPCIRRDYVPNYPFEIKIVQRIRFARPHVYNEQNLRPDQGDAVAGLFNTVRNPRWAALRSISWGWRAAGR